MATTVISLAEFKKKKQRASAQSTALVPYLPVEEKEDSFVFNDPSNDSLTTAMFGEDDFIPIKDDIFPIPRA